MSMNDHGRCGSAVRDWIVSAAPDMLVLSVCRGERKVLSHCECSAVKCNDALTCQLVNSQSPSGGFNQTKLR